MVEEFFAATDANDNGKVEAEEFEEFLFDVMTSEIDADAEESTRAALEADFRTMAENIAA